MTSARDSCKKRPASSQSPGSPPLAGIQRETGFKKLVNAPDGPKSLEELLGWSDHVFHMLNEADCAGNFLDNISDGVVLGSHFSGFLTPEIAMDQLIKSASKALLEPPADEILKGRLYSCYTCDDHYASRQVAGAWQKSSAWWKGPAEGHIFGNIFDAVSMEALRKMDRFKRHQKEGIPEEALVDLQNYFFRHSAEVFEVAPCLRHDAHCRLVCSCSMACDGFSLQLRRFSHSATSVSSPTFCMLFQFCALTSCRCNAYTNIPAHFKDPLSVEVAGSPCVGWSALGKREGVNHESHLAFLTWAAKMRQLLPKIIIHECTAGFPVSILKHWFEDLYIIMTMQLDPLAVGHCTHRPSRRYTWCIRRDQSFAGSCHEFQMMFAANPVMGGDIFFCAPDGYLQSGLSHLAMNRFCVPHALAQVDDWSVYYPPGARERMPWHLKQWLKKNPQPASPPSKRVFGKSRDESQVKMVKSWPILADLDQNPGFGPSASMFCPTLVGHGTVHCYAKNRCMVPEEHLLAMGYPVFHQDFPHKYAIDHMLTKSEIKKFAGNAMYLPIIGMQLGYIIAKIEKTTKETPVEDVRASSSSFMRKHSGMSFSSGDGMGSPCKSTPDRRTSTMSVFGSPPQSTP